MAISWDTAEKNLTAWVAAQLQGVTDHSVFRNAFPERFTEGAAVSFEQGRPASQNRLHECEAVIRLRFCERADLFSRIALLCAALPRSRPQDFCTVGADDARVTFPEVQEPGVPRFQAEIRFSVTFL